MAFLPHKFDGTSRPQAIEYLPCSAITPKVGMVLTWSSGKLAICQNSDAGPKYLSLIEASAAVAAGTLIPVLKILPDMVFKTKFSADAHAVNDGTKVTIADTGLTVTATPTKGVAEIVGREGTGVSGDVAYVRLA